MRSKRQDGTGIARLAAPLEPSTRNRRNFSLGLFVVDWRIRIKIDLIGRRKHRINLEFANFSLTAFDYNMTQMFKRIGNGAHRAIVWPDARPPDVLTEEIRVMPAKSLYCASLAAAAAFTAYTLCLWFATNI